MSFATPELSVLSVCQLHGAGLLNRDESRQLLGLDEAVDEAAVSAAYEAAWLSVKKHYED